MRILVLTDRYPPYYLGGYELMCHQITEGLRVRGHTMVVLTTTFGVNAKTVDEHVHRVLHYRGSDYRGVLRLARPVNRFFQGRRNYWIAHRLATETNPDLAFVWNMASISILPVLAMQDLGIRTAFTVGSHWLADLRRTNVGEPSRLLRWYRSGRIGFRRFEDLELDAAIMVSETLKQSYGQAGFNLENTVVIPNGIPAEWIAPQPPMRQWSKRPIRLLFVGRLVADKGPDIAVRAVEHLVKVCGRRELRLDLVGDGRTEYVDALRRLITSSNLENIIRLTGFLPRLELIQRYAEYDVLLFPTVDREGCPCTIIEAMAKGLTVIASDISGPRDIIQDGKNGLLVVPNEPVLLAEAIETIIRAPSLAAQIGWSAIQTVRQKYTSDRVFNQYEAFLESLAG